jgi:hypothetical protein
MMPKVELNSLPVNSKMVAEVDIACEKSAQKYSSKKAFTNEPRDLKKLQDGGCNRQRFSGTEREYISTDLSK